MTRSRLVFSMVVGGLVAASTAGALGWSSAGVRRVALDRLVRSVPARISAGSRRAHGFEYVFSDGGVYVYAMGGHHRLIEHVRLPQLIGVRGVGASPRDRAVFVAYGGFGGATGTGSLLKLDLVTNRVIWTRTYGTGVDSFAVSRDGRRLYLPTGEADPSGVWLVVSGRTGRVITRIHAGAGAHNTVLSRDGRLVFLGGRGSNRLAIADTRSDRVVKRIGPLLAGVRPFTINRATTLAVTTATRFAGFQVSSVTTGLVLHTVSFGGFAEPTSSYTGDAPSHGIVLSPDGTRVWVLDAPHDLVRVFRLGHDGRATPVAVTTIRLSVPVRGEQPRCTNRCVKSGWLQASRAGRQIYVGDAGDVIDARSYRIVAHLPALERTRQSLEIEWREGIPAATGSRNGPQG